MPISDEVIELAPVAKTKKKLIILFVAIGVLAALSIAFLVMYLVKPAPVKNPIYVTKVEVPANNLFKSDDVDASGNPKAYAAIGHKYYIVARVTVGKDTSTDVNWDISPADRGAITEETDRKAIEEYLAANSVTLADNESVFVFTPKENNHGKEITVKARSASKVAKYAEIKFTIVNQGTEEIIFDYFQQGNDSSNRAEIKGDSISLPFFNTATNNKDYFLAFNKFGKVNSSTGEHNDITVVGGADAISVSSSNEDVVKADLIANRTNMVKLQAKGVGEATVTITANGSNNDAQAYVKTLNIKVDASADLGYIEKIYFFNKAIVSKEFIKSVSKADGKLDPAKLTQNELTKNYPGLILNPQRLTFPVTETYDDLYKHILVDPVSLQYDKAKDEIIENWYLKALELKVSNKDVLQTQPNSFKLTARALAGNTVDSTTCTLTLSERSKGGIKASSSVEISVVACNTEADLTLINTADKSSTVAGGTANVSQGTELDMKVEYSLQMSGKTDMDTAVQLGYISKTFSLTFDEDVLEITLTGIENALKSGTVYTLPDSAMKLERKGAETTAASRFVGTVAFKVKVKNSAANGTSGLKFKKFGTTISGEETQSDKDCTWERSVNIDVQKRAEAGDVYLKSYAELTTPGTEDYVAWIANNVKEEHYITEGAKPKTLKLYLQYQQDGTTITASDMFDLVSLYKTTATVTPKVVLSPNNQYFDSVEARNGVLKFIPSNSISPDDSNRAAQAKISFKDVSGKDMPANAGITINIYLYDAVTSFGTMGAQDSVTYSRTNLPSVTVSNSDVIVRRHYVPDFAQYSFNKVDIYYGSDVTNEDNKLTAVPSGGGYNYFYAGDTQRTTPLFTFSKTSDNFTVQAGRDLFEYSYNWGIDFNKISVKIPVNDGDFYDGTTKPFARVALSFIRKADGFAIFDDNDVRLGEDEVPDPDAFINGTENYSNIAYDAMSGNTITLKASSTVIVYDNDENGYVEIIVKQLTGSLPLDVEETTIQIANSLGNIAQSANISFSAPIVNGTISNADSRIRYSGEIKTLTFNIRNLARSLDGITVYDHETDRTNTHLVASAAGGLNMAGYTVNFGIFANDVSHTTVELYIQLAYESYNSLGMMYFEPALLTLPWYLDVDTSTNNGITAPTGARPTSGNITYTIVPTVGVEESSIPVVRLIMTLRNDAPASLDDKLRLSRQNASEDNEKIEINLTIHVGTGLGIIRLTPSDGSAAKTLTFEESKYNASPRVPITLDDPITYSIKVKTPSQASSYIYSLGMEFLRRDNTYPNLAFMNSQDWFSAAISFVNEGSYVDMFTPTNNAKANDPSIAFALNGNYVNGSAKYRVEVVDNANGADSHFIFYVEFTVTTDIYALALKDGSNNEYVSGDTVTVVTDDVPGATKNVVFTYLYNEKNNNRQPVSPSGVTLTLGTVSGGSFTRYTGTDVRLDGMTLTVNDDLVNNSGTVYCLRAQYDQGEGGATVTSDVYVLIHTKAHTISFKPTGNDIVPVSGAATVAVRNSSQNTFTLAAQIKNNGDGSTPEGTTVTYAIYSHSDYAESHKLGSGAPVSINTVGVITINPNALTGTYYYRASFTDVLTTGSVVRTLDVAITYYVTITGVSLGDIDSTTYNTSSSTVYMYYVDSDMYTELDLTSKLKPVNAFGIAFGSSDIDYKIDSNDSELVYVSGKKLIAKGATTGTDVTVTAKYQKGVAGIESETQFVFHVVVNTISDSCLTLNESSGEIDIISNSSLAVTPTITDYDGLESAYTLTEDPATSILNITPANSINKTVSLRNRASNRYDDAASLTARVVYSLASGSSLNIVSTATSGGNSVFEFTKPYAVSVTPGTYSPAFRLMCGTSPISVYDATAPNPAMHAIEAKTYSVEVLDIAHGVSAAKYSLEATGVIQNVTEFTNGTTTLSIINNASGAFTVTVKVTLYGYEYTAEQNYFFTFGTAATTNLYYDGSLLSGTLRKNIDFSDNSDPHWFRYEIVGVDVANVTVTKCVGGDIDPADISAVTADGTTKYYFDVKVRRRTTLSIGAYYTVGGTRKVYLDTYNVELDAYEPEFEITMTGAATAKPGDSPTLTVAKKSDNNSQYGSISNAVFSVVSGDQALIASPLTGTGTSRTLTFKNTIDADTDVVIKAVVTLSGGVFDGKSFTAYKTIRAYAIGLPTITGDSVKEVIAGGSYVAAGQTLNKTVAYTGGNQIYTGTDSDITYSVFSCEGLTQGTDFTFTANGGIVTVNDNNRTKAGGKIVVRASFTVTDKPNKNTVITKDIEFIVKPQIQNPGKTISNGAGVYDIAGAVLPYTLNDTGWFVKSSDKYTVEYSLHNSADDSSVAEINGSKLTLKSNITEAKTIELDATLTFTSGNYVGVSYNTSATVTVNHNGATAAERRYVWSDSSKAYTLASGSLMNAVTVPTGETAVKLSVECKKLVGSDYQPVDGAYVSDNGTSSPSIAVDKYYNVVFTNGQSDESFTAFYTVTTEEGNVYFCTGTIKVAPVVVQVATTIDNESYSSNVNIEAGSSFVFGITLNPDVFTNTVSGVECKVGNEINNDYLTARVSDKLIMFTAAAIGTAQTVNVSVSILVGTATYNATFSAVITPPSSVNNLFTVTELGSRNFKKDTSGSATIVSVWTNGATNGTEDSKYRFLQSVTVTSRNNENLNNYFTKIELLKSNNDRYTGGEATNITSKSVTLYFETSYGWGGTNHARMEASSFKIRFTINDDAAFDPANFTVELKVYNGTTNRALSQTVPASLTLRVIDKVRVTFDINTTDTVTNAPTTMDFGYDLYYTGLPTDVSRVGYHDATWYSLSTDGTRTNVTASTRVTKTDAHTLYASWEALNYTLKFENGGTIANQSATYDGEFPTLPTPAARNGYTFDGWYDKNNKKVLEGDKVRITDDTGILTLTAVWKANEYLITFAPDSGTFDDAELNANPTVTVVYDKKLGALPAATRSGYALAGWYTKNGSGNDWGTRVYATTDVSSVISAASIATPTTATTLYAKWNKVDYTVKLVANGGTISAGDVTGYKVGETHTFPVAAQITRTGYDFAGWWTNDGSGNNWGNQVYGITSADTGNKVFYAKWTVKKFTVTFALGGGNINGDGATVVKTDVEYGTVLSTIAPADPVKAHCSFNGWNNGYAPSGTVSDNIDYTAQWNAETYTVTLVAYGGTITGNVTTYTYGVGASLPGTVTKDNYNFAGWYSVDGSAANDWNDTYKATELSATDFGDKVFYAKWTAKTYSVALTAAGCTFTDITSYTYGAGATLPVSVTKAGYTFDGWWTRNGSGNDWGERAYSISATDSGAKAFYAKMVPAIYTVTFDAGDGSLATGEGTKLVTYNTVYGALPTPTLTGCVFEGWYDGATKITSASAYTATENKTLTAKWQVVITFDAGLGSVDPASNRTIDRGTAYGALPTATRTGYANISSWKNGAAAVTASTVFNTSATLTLATEWAANEYTVTFALTGGNIGGNTSAVTVNDAAYGTLISAIKPATDPVKTGYTFAGWGVADDAVVTGEATYTAQWTVVTYTITLVANGGTVDAGWNTTTYTVESSAITLPNVTKTGYSFGGWMDNTAGSTAETIAQGSTGDKTYYAVWTSATVTVTLDLNGGNINGSTVDIEFTLPYNSDFNAFLYLVPVKNNFVFENWENGSHETVNTALTGIVEDVKLTAVYAPVYTVTLNACGGNIAVTPLTRRESSKYGSLGVPTKQGYTFGGWYTAANGGGEQITDETGVNNDDEVPSNIELFAKWTAVGVLVTFDLNAGGDPKANLNSEYYRSGKTVQYGETYGHLPTPIWEGYTFYGWKLVANGTEFIDENTTVTNPANHTLYACWQGRTITISANGGYFGNNTENRILTVNHIPDGTRVGDVIGNNVGTTNSPTNPGYSNSGAWFYTDATGEKKVESSESNPTLTSATVTSFYVKWSKAYTFNFFGISSDEANNLIFKASATRNVLTYKIVSEMTPTEGSFVNATFAFLNDVEVYDGDVQKTSVTWYLADINDLNNKQVRLDPSKSVTSVIAEVNSKTGWTPIVHTLSNDANTTYVLYAVVA